MRALVLGGDGMLGHKVFQVLNERFETHATFRETDGPWTTLPMYRDLARQRMHGGVDALILQNVTDVLTSIAPNVVVNCIGIVKQLDQANDPITSITLNALLPHHLAALCAQCGARLIHVSTDCVFSGRAGNYSEDDLPDAEDLYGRTKALGEVKRSGTLTLRTSVIGRDFLKRSSLIEWFLNHRGGVVRGFRNSIYSGLTTRTLACVIGDLIASHTTLEGLYQVASKPISKHDLLVMIRDAMGLDIEIEAYDDPPCDRSLSSARFVAATGYRIPTWKAMIDALAADPTPYDEWRRTHGGT
jgi:dTDP-4-dehydrorhamnose reductase